MIRVTIELIPHGIGRPEHLHTIEIANDGTGDERHGDYKARVGRKGIEVLAGRPWTEKAASGFPRRAKNAVYLLARVLKNLGYA